MSQKKKVLVICSIAVVILAGAGGTAYWHYHKKSGRLDNLSVTTSSDIASAGNTSQNTDGASQLNVSGNDNFGQLGVNTGQTSGQTTSGQSTESQGQTSTSGSATSSATSEAEQMLNPATFSQYDTPQFINGTTTSYRELQVGTGTEIAPGHMVAVIYKGWLTNGTLFDESKAGANGQMQPFMFEYGANPAQVIPGWTEGLEGMKVGGVRLLIIPPAVGYGAAGQASIPGNSVLIFAVQLQAVQ
jgi:FKBP-type peptidyl-prolyl cis-trans isomerase FkpA